MGMYDHIDNVTAYCPQCGEKLTGLQTKDFFDPFLEHYGPGDRLPEDRKEVAYITAYAICDNCGLFTNMFFEVDKDILIGKMC